MKHYNYEIKFTDEEGKSWKLKCKELSISKQVIDNYKVLDIDGNIYMASYPIIIYNFMNNSCDMITDESEKYK